MKITACCYLICGMLMLPALVSAADTASYNECVSKWRNHYKQEYNSQKHDEKEHPLQLVNEELHKAESKCTEVSGKYQLPSESKK